MTSTELHSLPRLGRVIREQLKSVAMMLRLPAIAAAALAAVALMLAIANFLRGGNGVDFAPELSLIPAFTGALLPFAVWHNEQRFGTAFLWTLPVDRARQALAKVTAGWILLLIAMAAFVLWLFILALITKGRISGDEMIQLLPTSDLPSPHTVDPSMLRTVRWAFPPVLWLVPFFAATATYILASAIALGLRHPFRWIAGAIAAVLMIGAVGQGIGSDEFWVVSSRIVNTLLQGRYRIDAVLSARTESLKTRVMLSNDEIVTAWRGLPVISNWIIATLLWTGLGVAGLYAAVMRHREGR